MKLYLEDACTIITLRRSFLGRPSFYIPSCDFFTIDSFTCYYNAFPPYAIPKVCVAAIRTHNINVPGFARGMYLSPVFLSSSNFLLLTTH
jgi:hypothetical protein